MKIKLVETIADIQFCSRAILTFRPILSADQLDDKTLSIVKGGFRMAYISNDEDSEAAAIIGFRMFEMYRTGKIIYIDDLFTFPEVRGRGYGTALLDYVHGVALASEIKTVHLVSGFDMQTAHRLYLNKGYVLPCHHFAKSVI